MKALKRCEGCDAAKTYNFGHVVVNGVTRLLCFPCQRALNKIRKEDAENKARELADAKLRERVPDFNEEIPVVSTPGIERVLGR